MAPEGPGLNSKSRLRRSVMRKILHRPDPGPGPIPNPDPPQPAPHPFPTPPIPPEPPVIGLIDNCRRWVLCHSMAYALLLAEQA